MRIDVGKSFWKRKNPNLQKKQQEKQSSKKGQQSLKLQLQRKEKQPMIESAISWRRH
jgi:hypothetical protein